MRILGIIPARGGSKGVPDKNIKLLGELPLLAYTAQSALASQFLTKVILSTDCPTIAAVAEQCAIEVPFLRPETLATDTASSIAVVQHAVSYLENQGRIF